MESILQVRNLTKVYGEIIAVDDVSFEVRPGEIMGFLGPNGAGKSTTIKIICGLVNATRGTVVIGGTDASRERAKANSLISGIVEFPDFYLNMSAVDNLKTLAMYYKNIEPGRIDKLLELVGLSNRKNYKVKSYSLGMKQRLGIAMSLLNNPKLLLLDEPNNGLDPAGILEMRNLLKKLASENNMAIVISSHQLAEVQTVCDTIGIINKGKLLGVKPISELLSGGSGADRTVVVRTDDGLKAAEIAKKIGKNVEIRENRIKVDIEAEKIPELTRALILEGISVLGLTTLEKTLEDIFMELTGNKGGAA